MKKKLTIPKEQEDIAVKLFYDLLPHYWELIENLPAELKLRLALNKFPSIAIACNEIANKFISTPKIARKAQKDLIHKISVDHPVEWEIPTR